MGDSGSSTAIEGSDVRIRGGASFQVHLNDSYIENSDGTQSYVGLGDAGTEDVVGDGIIDTQFQFGGAGQIYTVDGIANPRSTAKYPDWVNDPSVTQYFWNPTMVGALWDPTNPDVFPEP